MRKDIVLVSNASMHIFPDNKLSDFRIRLPKPLQFDGKWRVAITRISFTKSYFNYEFKAGDRWMHLIRSDTKEKYEPAASDLSLCRLTARPLAGWYTPDTFVEMLTSCARDLIIDGAEKVIDWPKFTLVNGFLDIEPGKYTDKDGTEKRWEVKFDVFTQAVLGIDNDPVRPVFLNQGFTDLYVYSDLVFPSIVGDQTCELMAIVDGQTGEPYGSHCVEVFDEPWFHPLAKNNFQEIWIYIRRDTGDAPFFRFGRVNLRLSFRTEDEL